MLTPLLATKFYTLRPTPNLVARPRLTQRLDEGLRQSYRLILVDGPDGIGKTRLALQAAAKHRPEFAQGVAFVPLAAVDSVEAIVPAIAGVLVFSFYGSTGLRVRLFNYLCDKQMLLVLDNVESEPGRGTAFTVLLPLQASEDGTDGK
jgi:hypothetical protein